ncbi:MAG: Wzz/FepE/Etk N-terminal domain-containing protein [Colwellia sp.]
MTNNNENQPTPELLAQQQAYFAQMQQNQMQQDDEIDLAELWRAIWAGKLTIILISFVFAIGSVAFALSKPNVYKASVLLAPISAQGGAGSLVGKFGGLASMAGINLGGGGTDKAGLALEIIKSRLFLENFIQKHDLLVSLMASKGWDINTDTLQLNEELYDSNTKKWLREVKPPKTPEPSVWEAYMAFSKLLTVSQDKTSSMVSIDMEFYSPTLAKEWLKLLVKDLNEFMRAQDQKEAQASIDYLKEQIQNIQVRTMETVFYQLIEEQTKNMMLTQVKAEYVLKTIDPAQVPEQKAGPKRALMVVLGTMLGGMLSVLIVLVRYYTNK